MTQEKRNRACDPPLLTKHSSPTASPFEVPRAELLRRLKNSSAKVIVVSAPAGFGKTTLLRQFRAESATQSVKSVWLAFDNGDNDVSRFLARFAAAVEEVEPAPKASKAAPGDHTQLALWITDRLTSLRDPFDMFLDDLDALHNPTVLSLITRGLEAVPGNVRIFIGARAVPEVGLAHIRNKGVLAEIGVTDLRFDESEAAEFLTLRRGLPLNPKQISELLDRTEGWAAALWLASLAIERRDDPAEVMSGFSGSSATIAAYFAEDVLWALPPNLHDFVLRSSILDELEPYACDAVCGVSDSLSLLQQLEQRNLFLQPIDGGGQRFRCHALFREFLQAELLHSHGKEVHALHRAASSVYIGLRRPEQAIRHALKGGIIDDAVRLIFQHVDVVLSQGRVRLVAQWLDQLPRSELEGNPKLRLIQAWCSAFIDGPKAALGIIGNLRTSELSAEQAQQLLALRPLLLAMTDQIEEAWRASTDALEKVPELCFSRSMLLQVLASTSIILGRHESARGVLGRLRLQHDVPVAGTHSALADSLEAQLDLMQGRLERATRRIKNVELNSEAATSEDAIVAVHVAEILFESGRCDSAERLLFVAAPLVQGVGLPNVMIVAHIIRSRIAWHRGHYDLALQPLFELESTGHRLGLARAVASARLERSTLYLGRNDSAGAMEQLVLAERAVMMVANMAAGMQHHWFSANDTLTPEIVRYRWMVRHGNATAAIPLLRSYLLAAKQAGRGRRALKVQILLAEAFHRSGEQAVGLRCLARVQHKAQIEGFWRTFEEEGPLIGAMLCELGTQRNRLEEADSLKPDQRFDEELRVPNGASPVALRQLLSSKELQVLQLVSQGMGNEVVAQRLFISATTVRTHLRKINSKLNASNRTEASIIGRRLGLITT